MTRHLQNVMRTMSVALIMITAAQATASAQSGEDNARAVISSQLESFLTGDFVAAYSHASPNIKQIFPTVDQFMQMVQGGYLPVLRPGNYAFGNTENVAENRVKQDVLIRAPDGSDWTATYYMEMQPDGLWKVDGVQLRKGAAGLI